MMELSFREHGTYFVYAIFLNCDFHVYFKIESYITYSYLSLNDAEIPVKNKLLTSTELVIFS